MATIESILRFVGQHRRKYPQSQIEISESALQNLVAVQGNELLESVFETIKEAVARDVKFFGSAEVVQEPQDASS